MLSGILPPHKKQDAPYPIPLDPPPSFSLKASGSVALPSTAQRTSNLAPVAAGRSGMRSAASSTVSYVSRVRDAVDLMCRCCMFCSTKNHSMPYHGIDGCPQMLKEPDDPRFSTTKEHYLKSWRKNLTYEAGGLGRHSICNKCHLPNGPGDGLHAGSGLDSVCAHPDLVPLVAYRVLMTDSLFQEARTHFGQVWKSGNAYLRWVTQASVDFPSNLLDVFVWFFALYFNRSHV